MPLPPPDLGEPSVIQALLRGAGLGVGLPGAIEASCFWSQSLLHLHSCKIPLPALWGPELGPTPQWSSQWPSRVTAPVHHHPTRSGAGIQCVLPGGTLLFTGSPCPNSQ